MDQSSTPAQREALVSWVQEALDLVTPGQFLLMEYLTDEDLPVEPYAQAALEPGGWSCEVVSAHHLPVQHWSLDQLAVEERGWLAPCGHTTNYWMPDVDLRSAAAVLVEALWFGRSCTDPDRYALSVGTFPPGSGDRAPVPDDLPLPA